MVPGPAPASAGRFTDHPKRGKRSCTWRELAEAQRNPNFPSGARGRNYVPAAGSADARAAAIA